MEFLCNQVFSTHVKIIQEEMNIYKFSTVMIFCHVTLLQFFKQTISNLSRVQSSAFAMTHSNKSDLRLWSACFQTGYLLRASNT